VRGDVAGLVSAQGGNAYRIQMNVAADLQRFCWLVQDGFETSLKQGSDSIVFSIEPHAVADIKPMERFAEVRLSALQFGDGNDYPSRRNRAALPRTVRVSCSATGAIQNMTSLRFAQHETLFPKALSGRSCW
jgi:hypothetical protein